MLYFFIQSFKKNAVRKVYKELAKQHQKQEDGENQPAFDFSVSFNNSSNQALAKKLLTEVRAVYGKKKWMKSTIKAAVHQHWRSMRDDKTRKTNNSFEKHRRQIKRSNRLKRKLSRRLSCLWQCCLKETREGCKKFCLPQTCYTISHQRKAAKTTQQNQRVGQDHERSESCHRRGANWGISKQNWTRRIWPVYVRNKKIIEYIEMVIFYPYHFNHLILVNVKCSDVVMNCDIIAVEFKKIDIK